MTFVQPPSSPIHIGFVITDFIKWGGGIWFSKTLLWGLASLPDQVKLTIIAPTDDALYIRLRRILRLLRKAIIHPLDFFLNFGSVSHEHLLWQRGIKELTAIIPKVVFYNGSEKDLLKRCYDENIDVLLPIVTPLNSDMIPWVGYLYDCQHKHFPEFFRSEELRVRDSSFRKMLHQASFVFSNAKAVLEDIRIFFPDYRAQLFSLPFSAIIGADELTNAEVDVKTNNYDVEENKYFIICNQFWIHKDHSTAFKAFAQFITRPECAKYKLICTGLMEDYRYSGYFQKIKTLVHELGISNHVVFTGYIDRADQLALLYGATALLQPTLFEGGPGGGAVSDALALGIHCIVSDILVNQELKSPLVSFFKVGDAMSLENLMGIASSASHSRTSTAVLFESRQKYARALGESLLGIAITARNTWLNNYPKKRAGHQS